MYVIPASPHNHVRLELRGGQQRRHDEGHVGQEILAQGLANASAGLEREEG